MPALLVWRTCFLLLTEFISPSTIKQALSSWVHDVVSKRWWIDPRYSTTLVCNHGMANSFQSSTKLQKCKAKYQTLHYLHYSTETPIHSFEKQQACKSRTLTSQNMVLTFAFAKATFSWLLLLMRKYRASRNRYFSFDVWSTGKMAIYKHKWKYHIHSNSCHF